MPAGKNDGSLRGKRYFTCTPQHGLFVQPAQLTPCAPPKTKAAERDQPDMQLASQWSAVENVLENEALVQARDGARIIRHLEQTHPRQQAQQRSPAPHSSRKGRATGSQPRSKARQLSGGGDMLYGELLLGTPLPADYAGPSFSQKPTAATMSKFLSMIKSAVVQKR
eukprot:CAMPEP_0119392614 /NCGR_PEP_ID=MMETSP1334-20130426/121884_1 /TAXON_ID=127549 /ORGANISM="Calcidiscus leptoporus, Strain RCC1130" /LENGTH=166 /DNA_ID=CAMNT_0007415495 /DNA_START=72 /DNA_END=569 /DNA_ORIENTATION=+